MTAALVWIAAATAVGVDEWAARHGVALTPRVRENYASNALRARDSAFMGETRFSGMSLKEFQSTLIHHGRRGLVIVDSAAVAHATAANWSHLWAKTGVRDQFADEECTAAWPWLVVDAMAAVGEGVTRHHLLSCASRLDCAHGSVDNALRRIKEDGVCAGGAAGECAGCASRSYPLRAYESVHGRYVEQAVAAGPVIAGVYAGAELQLYTGGVVEPATCLSTPNHGVLIVGFGETEGGRPYWIVRNSWGDEWGERGYFRIARGANACGIEREVLRLRRR